MEQTPISEMITPIQKAINELRFKINDSDTLEDRMLGLHTAINIIMEIFPYEKTYHRNISDKAWGDGVDYACTSLSNRGHKINESYFEKDKQTYLNQNHPL